MMLSSVHIFQLLAFSLLLALGQMLFKVAASMLPPLSTLAGIMALSVNPWFYLALALYGSATLLWILILQDVPLSLAYPFVALGFVIIPLASFLIFKEPLNIYYGLGVACIIGGLGLITVLGGK